jgi:hypothetical protein
MTDAFWSHIDELAMIAASVVLFLVAWAVAWQLNLRDDGGHDRTAGGLEADGLHDRPADSSVVRLHGRSGSHGLRLVAGGLDSHGMSRGILSRMRRRPRRWRYKLIWYLAPRNWRLTLRWRSLGSGLEYIELGPLEIQRREARRMTT